MYSVKITEPEELCDELQEFFFSEPYGSISKTDFQEKIFFLLDKYSEHSLTKNSDYELGLKLRCTKQKAANIRASVTAKFGEPYDTENYFRFCRDFLLLETYSLNDSEEIFVAVEDSAIRNFLDYIFLKDIHRAIEYKNNRTLVAFDKESFKLLLKSLKDNLEKARRNKDVDGDLSEALDGLCSELEKITDDEISGIFKKIIEGTKAEKLFEVCGLGMELIETVIIKNKRP